MQIKPNHPLIGMPTVARIQMFSGDRVELEYTDPQGNQHVFNVSAQHLVFMAVHEKTDAAIICSPSNGQHMVKVLQPDPLPDTWYREATAGSRNPLVNSTSG